MAKFAIHPRPQEFDLLKREMSQALAESILALDFPENDTRRIAELNTRANEGQLCSDEEAELETYLDFNDGSRRPVKPFSATRD